MGLKNLTKSPFKDTNDDAKALAFIGGAALVSADMLSPATKRAVFKRTTFSLTDELNQQIDALSLTPRTFRVSRSDVVKAGVQALRKMPEAQLLALLAQAAQTVPLTEVAQLE